MKLVDKTLEHSWMFIEWFMARGVRGRCESGVIFGWMTTYSNMQMLLDKNQTFWMNNNSDSLANLDNFT
jgi:hypothetical protein